MLATAGDAVGIGGAQALVGAGMGLGVGLMQGRALRSLLGSPMAWMLATTAGLAAPFLVTDLVAIPYSLQLSIAAGGLAAGLLQARQLATRHFRMLPWIVASVMGWTLAGASAWAADAISRARTLTGIAGALTFLGVVATGGLLLGVVTGAALVRLPRR